MRNIAMECLNTHYPWCWIWQNRSINCHQAHRTWNVLPFIYALMLLMHVNYRHMKSCSTSQSGHKILQYITMPVGRRDWINTFFNITFHINALQDWTLVFCSLANIKLITCRRDTLPKQRCQQFNNWYQFSMQ